MESSVLKIEGFGYSGEIRTQGSKLASLSYKGRNLIEPYNEVDTRNLFSGDVLAPWPNRLASGKYLVRGHEYSAPINESSRDNALHGLVYKNLWRCSWKSKSACILETTLQPSKAYGFQLDFQSKFELTEEGLFWRISATNRSSDSAPYGVSIHPYLVADENSLVDSWMMQFPARRYLEVDPIRLLPTNTYDSSYRQFEFSQLRKVGDLEIDHAFLIDRNCEESYIDLLAPTGNGVRMKFGSEANWIQIHTADRDGASDGRKSMAVEPMTCPPDAFNSGRDLVWLSEGQKHSAIWNLAAL